MTGALLALAGLTCGDGGPGAEASLPAATVSFDGTWEGTLYLEDGRTFPVRQGAGVLTVHDGRDHPTLYASAIQTTGPGTLRLTERWPTPREGIYRFDGWEAALCIERRPGRRPVGFRAGPHTILLVLRPAAPRNP